MIEKYRACVTSLQHGTLNAHHKLISEVRAVLKTLAKVSDICLVTEEGMFGDHQYATGDQFLPMNTIDAVGHRVVAAFKISDLLLFSEDSE